MFDIGLFIFIIVIFLLSIFVHELGHFLYFRTLNKDIDVRFYYKSWRRFGFKAGTPEDYNNLTEYEYFQVNFWGVAAGLIFLCVVSLAFNSLMLLFIFPYLLGCKEDIRIMYLFIKGVKI